MSRMRERTRIVLCLLWGLGILAGFYQVTVYSTTQAKVLSQPKRWPSGTLLAPPVDRPVLLMAIHPGCGCSRATLEELARITVETRTPFRVEILMYIPDMAKPEADWLDGELAAQARSINGVLVHVDPKGLEASRFDLSVSGQTALYSIKGRLLFSGGITPTRGHIGDNAGHAAIVSILSGRPPATTNTPVFGCSLKDET